MPNLLFSATLDKTAKVVSICTCLLIVGIIVYLLLSLDEIPIYILLLNIGLVLLPFICYGLKPSRYEITENTIVIHRLFKNIIIEKSTITNMEQLSKSELKNVWRMMGIGGVFGYIGKFSATKLGQMTWYATNLNNAVLIHISDKQKILITPQNPEAFIEAIPLSEQSN